MVTLQNYITFYIKIDMSKCKCEVTVAFLSKSRKLTIQKEHKYVLVHINKKMKYVHTK